MRGELGAACDAPAGTPILDPGRRFGGIVARDRFAHLDADEQWAMFPVSSRHLLPGGALLFTSGPDAGTATGAVAGRPVPHARLAPPEYAARLEAAGLAVRAVLAEDPGCAGHSVWLARRTPG